MSTEEKVKSNKPPDTAFRQQRLPTWEPIMTPLKLIIIFIAIGKSYYYGDHTIQDHFY